MKIEPFYVAPVLPDELKSLKEIAMNLWFSWNWDAVRLFIMIDADIWEEVYQNPVAMLGRVPQARFKELAQDDGFVANVERVHMNLKNYLASSKWFERHHPESKDLMVAYFSCEYGLDEGLPVYSGGLGILSGDHLKSASDLGIPLAAVGLLYRQGYFRQRLNADGWQLEEYPENDWYKMPVTLVTNEKKEPLVIAVEMGEKNVFAQIWRVEVGNVNLYLLDTNFAANDAWGREITTQLYGGDRDMRIRQELLLGIGGYRALKALGLKPTVFHINEGHSAFQLLERIRDYMESNGLTLAEAREIVWSSSVFTTHTPVPAGNERFDPQLLKKYLGKWIGRLGITWEDFLRIGQEPNAKTEDPYVMTILALRRSAFSNGVSKLHGEVSRKMWRCIWPNVPHGEIPISHITNGIHTRTWISHDLNDLFESYLGPRFVQRPWEFSVWDRIDRIPDIELWRTHQRRRERLVFFARNRLKKQLVRRGLHSAEIAAAEEALSPHALTIGFARRFATYKRAHLLFSDMERLKRLLTVEDQPVQFIFAGKAHPQDTPAKEIIKSIVHAIQEEPFRSRIVFLEDYDINVARYLVQGVDVWLNTPQRPLEASGTSGMKVAPNGGLNVSILDGWWDEGFDPEVGWAIGNREEFRDPAQQDKVECHSLFHCFENEIIPLFFKRDNTGLPRDWIAKMKKSIKILGRHFNTHRMLQEYAEQFYLPGHRALISMKANDFARGKDMASWVGKISSTWKDVAITHVGAVDSDLEVDDELTLSVSARLASLSPDDVAVELLCGLLDSKGEIQNGTIYKSHYTGESKDGIYNFRFEIPCKESGRHGYAIRIRPNHPDIIPSFACEFMRWA
ncbi:MAG: alpha-glucan family phosphorylase [Candidatus Omnitrophota bacterium]